MSKRIIISSFLAIPLLVLGGTALASSTSQTTTTNSGTINIHSITDTHSTTKTSGNGSTSQVGAGQTNSTITISNDAGTVTLHDSDNVPTTKEETTTTKTSNGGTVTVTNTPDTHQIEVNSAGGKDKTTITTGTNEINKTITIPNSGKVDVLAAYYGGNGANLADSLDPANNPQTNGSSLTNLLGLYLFIAIPLLIALILTYLGLFKKTHLEDIKNHLNPKLKQGRR